MMFLDYLISAIAIGMTFLYGCVGEILTEKSGHLNLGIPGIMCIGGASGCVVLKLTASMPLFFSVTFSILAAVLGGALMGLLYCLLTVTLKANQNVTGLAMTTFGVGATKFIMNRMAQTATIDYLYAVKGFRFPFGKSTTGFAYWGILMYVAVLLALGAAYVLTRTQVGLHLRAVGENPATADAAGINVTAYKYGATCIGSGIAALGGLYYIMDISTTAEAYKAIEAFGWLSVALVIFTLWKPQISIVGSILFGLLYLASDRIPTLFNISLPMWATPLLQSLPYVVTIIVLVLTSIKKKRENQPPASLGLPYFREER